MALDLIRRLRTCSPEERRSVALKLAQTGTDEAVRELIRVAEGRRRHFLSWYNLDDQLLGVEALGETSNPKALGYLRRVYRTVNMVDDYEHRVDHGGSEPMDDDEWTIHYKIHIYPRARGGLAEELSYRKVVSVHEECYGEISKKDWHRWGAYDDNPEDQKVHKIFRGAIEKLESSLS